MERSDAETMLAKGNETILLLEETRSNESWHCRLYSGIAIESWRRPHRSRRLCSPQQYNGIVHLTVSPLAMLEIGGRELARRLLRQHPTKKTLFVSGYDDETIQHHGLTSGLSCSNPTVSQD